MGASLASKLGTPDESEELGFCSAVVLSVQTDQSVRTVIDESIRMFSNKVRFNSSPEDPPVFRLGWHYLFSYLNLYFEPDYHVLTCCDGPESVINCTP